MPDWVADGAIFFVTLCTHPRHVNQLCNEAASELLFRSIEFNRERGHWWPFLVLLMPDHLHGLFTFAPEPGMKKAIKDWKHYVCRTGAITWQRDFFDHRLRKDESFDEKAYYIRQNPVRAGLAKSAGDWPYAREWLTRISIR